MLQLLQPSAWRGLASATRSLSSSLGRRAFHGRTSAVAAAAAPSTRRSLLWASAAAVSGVLAWQSSIQLDAEPPVEADQTIDPASSIAFPNTLKIQSKQPLPTFSLIGVGVRTVSFLGIKVYSVGFYADLNSPNLNISKAASPEEKIEHIVRNAALVIRIVPTRSTSFSHLRDGFLRALQARLLLCKQRVAAPQIQVMLPGVEYNTNLDSDDVVSSFGVVTVGKVSVSTLAADTLKIAQGEKGFIANFAYEVSKHRCYERELKGLTTKVAY